MIWTLTHADYNSASWQEARTPVGYFVIDGNLSGGRYAAIWYPAGLSEVEAVIGRYTTIGAAKRACKRYVKTLAAAFKAMAKAGWE